ncbi:M1 family metallopeptidase [Chryseobacterium sp.]|uniref:M1 family metallopeptidase n=1 Tax=Chryseobacterium sp. TaxID=1871047 RepID=UPI0011C72BF6|nr:M1 family metallopeptidase [Chryseobacterium sp.]TXF79114.1 T9SS type A sorting domain-containing protein [Chryseobacterium sp.]
MKKIYLFLLLSLFSVAVSAQNEELERKALIAKEISNYNKMVEFNVNPNTLNYDLKYQRMDLTLNPGVYNVSGSVTSHFTPNQNISSIYFDLTTALTVSQVTYHGTNVTFQQLPTKELKIDFPAQLPSNTLDSLTIHYSGAPDLANNAFANHMQSGTPVLSTLSEPYGAQDWFPTKQSMNDKIDRFDFKITTPNQYSVAANGKMMSETALAGNQKLTFWRTQYPMAAYLVAVSITNFTKINDVIGTPPFPFVNYVYPTTAANTGSMANIEWTKQAMSTFETYFGPYPFRNEKYGHMEYGYSGVCMEHQTMSSMSGWGKGVIAHELAHQWFGDKVTCGDWNDIWLNEGFATFGEHLVNEKLLMNNADFLNYLLSQKNYITSSTGGSTYVDDAFLSNQNVIFSGRLTYAKGGYILRMLKWILGDAAFYQAVQDYHSRPNLAYNYAKSTDLKASLLQSTGRDFTEFFNDWLYGQGYPTYTIKWAQNTSNTNLVFLVSQVQSHSSVSFFEMPLPIKVNGTGGQTAYFALNNTSNNQYFNQPVSFPVASVEFNYDYQILEKNSTVTNDITLGVKTSENEEFTMYPIPAKNELFFKGISRTTGFEIYSIDGKLLRKGTYTPSGSINISELVPGTYVMSINGKHIKFTKK